MSYSILEHVNHGYRYSVTVNGLTTGGWRQGTREDVEKHVKFVDEFCTLRAAGRVPKRNANGTIRETMNGKPSKKRKTG